MPVKVGLLQFCIGGPVGAANAVVRVCRLIRMEANGQP